MVSASQPLLTRRLVVAKAFSPTAASSTRLEDASFHTTQLSVVGGSVKGHKYASLVQLVSELSVDNVCVASKLREALRQHDPGCFEESGCKRFKQFVLKAQAEGAPVEWIAEGGAGGIKLTLSAASPVEPRRQATPESESSAASDCDECESRSSDVALDLMAQIFENTKLMVVFFLASQQHLPPVPALLQVSRVNRLSTALPLKASITQVSYRCS